MALIEWVQVPDNLTLMKDELLARGVSRVYLRLVVQAWLEVDTLHAVASTLQVKVLSFYDVVIDFILLDSFDDLENPPKSVVSVVNNRWLSNGFKESVKNSFYINCLLWNFVHVAVMFLVYF